MYIRLLILMILCFKTFYCLPFNKVSIKNKSDKSQKFSCTIPAYSELILKLKKLPKPELQSKLLNAILKDDPELIRLAVKAGANVNEKINNKKAFFVAVSCKKVKSCKVLLDLGIEVNEEDVELAIKSCNLKLAIDIALHGNLSIDKEYLGQSLLKRSIYSGEFKLALLLLSNNAKLFDSIESIMNYILEYFVVNKPDFKTYPNKEIVKLIQKFISMGYDVNSDDIWYLHESNSSICYHPEVMKVFIDNGANPNKIIDVRKKTNNLCWAWTPLMRAIHSGNKKSVEMLLKAGADVKQKAAPFGNQCNYGYLTPLSFAINLGDFPQKSDIIELLIAYGA